MKRSTNPLVQLKLEGLRQTLDEMMPRVKQVMKQTRARIHRGDTRSEDELLSVFEPSTEIIRKGKSGKPNEFGKMVKLQEAENQIIIEFEVYDRRPSDSDLCWFRQSMHIRRRSAAPLTCWRQTPHSISTRTRPRQGVQGLNTEKGQCGIPVALRLVLQADRADATAAGRVCAGTGDGHDAMKAPQFAHHTTAQRRACRWSLVRRRALLTLIITFPPKMSRQ